MMPLALSLLSPRKVEISGRSAVEIRRPQLDDQVVKDPQFIFIFLGQPIARPKCAMCRRRLSPARRSQRAAAVWAEWSDIFRPAILLVRSLLTRWHKSLWRDRAARDWQHHQYRRHICCGNVSFDRPDRRSGLWRQQIFGPSSCAEGMCRRARTERHADLGVERPAGPRIPARRRSRSMV